MGGFRLPSAAYAFTLLAAALTLLPAPRAHAQLSTGIGEDAVVVPFGVLRAEIGGSWESWRERYTSAPDGTPLSERVPLAIEFSGTPFGVSNYPALLPVRSALRAVTGDQSLDVNLGAVTTRADALSARTVFRMQLGIGARLALLASVPYVQTRTSVSVDVDPDGANLGLNPGLLSDDAAIGNEALIFTTRSAANELLLLVQTCAASPGSAGCDRVDDDPDAALNLAEDAVFVADALGFIYGEEGFEGSSFVPITGSPLDDALVARIAGLAEGLAAYGIGILEPDARPVGATPLAAGQFGLSDVGVAGQIERYGVGDIEVGAKLLLLDTFGRLPAATRPQGLALRLAVGGIFRYGRNSADSLGTPLDIGVGGGQNDIEGRGWLDLGFGERLSLSAAARYGVQLSDEPTMSMPGTLEGVVERDLGDYLELDLVPRVALGRSISLAGLWQLRRKAEDSYTGSLTTPDGLPVDAALLGVGTETREQRAGAGIAFSTMDAYGRGRTNYPLDVTYRYTRTITGAGQLTNHSGEHRITGRMYLRIFGNARTR